MKENSIFITDENGKEVEMKIYMTFDMNDKQYVVTYVEGNEDELYSFTYDDNTKLLLSETTNGLTSTFEYDQKGNLIKQINP